MLDLFAGSGAVGLEALSRGAARVVFVESDPRAAQVIRDNLAAVALPGGELVSARWSGSWPRAGPEAAFDLVVADPPYAASASRGHRDAAALAGRGWLAPLALVAVERATRAGLSVAAGYRAGQVPPLWRGDLLVRSRRS